MSRIGRAPIAIPAGVEIKVEDNNVVTVKGPKGTLTQQFNPNMAIAMENGVLHVTRPDDAKENRALHGLTRTLIHNMVVGVTEGYKKELDVNGVGYRVAKEGNKLVMNLGYSHQVIVEEEEGITIEVPAPTRSSSTAVTSSRWASLPPKCGRSVPPSLTRARASSTSMKLSAARLVRPAPRSKKEVCQNDQQTRYPFPAHQAPQARAC